MAESIAPLIGALMGESERCRVVLAVGEHALLDHDVRPRASLDCMAVLACLLS